MFWFCLVFIIQDFSYLVFFLALASREQLEIIIWGFLDRVPNATQTESQNVARQGSLLIVFSSITAVQHKDKNGVVKCVLQNNCYYSKVEKIWNSQQFENSHFIRDIFENSQIKFLTPKLFPYLDSSTVGFLVTSLNI